MKKIFALLVCVFAFSALAVSANAMTFSDLPASHWAYNNVQDMVSRGIITGYPDGTFKPEGYVTRGEFCKMLANAGNVYVNSNNTGAHWAAPYAEALKKSTWYYKDWYLQNNDLDSVINRGEVTVGIRDVYLGYPQSLITMMDEVNGHLMANYADYANMGGFVTSIYTMSIHNIMNGYEDGCFHHEYPITRAELCAVLSRAFGSSSGVNGGNSSSSGSGGTLDVSMSTNSTVSKNVKKLKNAIIQNGQRTSGGYGFKTSFGGATTSLFYLSDDNVCTFSLLTNSSDGTEFRTTLYLYEDEIPAFSVFVDDEMVLVGNYSQPSESLNIIKTPGGSLEGSLLSIVEASYDVFDSFLDILGLSYSSFNNFDMSDFGIGL